MMDAWNINRQGPWGTAASCSWAVGSLERNGWLGRFQLAHAASGFRRPDQKVGTDHFTAALAVAFCEALLLFAVRSSVLGEKESTYYTICNTEQ